MQDKHLEKQVNEPTDDGAKEDDTDHGYGHEQRLAAASSVVPGEQNDANPLATPPNTSTCPRSAAGRPSSAANNSGGNQPGTSAMSLARTLPTSLVDKVISDDEQEDKGEEQEGEKYYSNDEDEGSDKNESALSAILDFEISDDD